MLFYIWNEILLGELIFQLWVFFEEMNSNGRVAEEKYVGMLRVQRERVNSKRMRYSSCFSQLKKCGETCCRWAKNIYPFGWRLQGGFLFRLIPYKALSSVYIHTSTHHENEDQRAGEERQRLYWQGVWERIHEEKWVENKDKVVIHLLKTVTTNPHTPILTWKDLSFVIAGKSSRSYKKMYITFINLYIHIYWKQCTLQSPLPYCWCSFE